MTRGQATDCAKGIASYRDLESLAADVCGSAGCPLFSELDGAGRPEENLDALKTALSAACEAAWAAGRT